VANWYLALVALLGYLVIGIIVPLISSAKLKESGVKYRAEFASFNAYFLDSIKGVKDIVLNNAGDEREKEVNRRSELLLKQTKIMKHNSSRAAAATELTVSLFIILTLAVGIVLVHYNMLTVGKMIIGVVAVFSSFGPVIAISALPGNLTQTFASGDRVLNLLAEKPAVMPVTDGQNITYENLTVDDLSFSYDGQTEVLNDIKMHAEKGEIIGIVGESGCGKSTFLKLLLRFWQKSGGSIAYNGVDVDNINSDNLLDNVTMVSQSTYLFDETIEDNLRIAKPNATMQEIEEACKLASVHDFIMSLPEGYQTKTGALGDNLSAGEKQRIGLARAFLKGSELILLDEPTSNVDSINEGIILQALKGQKSKKSIILVSHRESTMAIADRIYRVENGKMNEVKV
jgi:ATP-binding cassette subfamily C protein